MIEQVNVEDFELSEFQNNEKTLLFARPLRPFPNSKDSYAMKILKLTSPIQFQNSEDNLKHYYQFVRHAYLLRPDFYGFNKNREMCIFMEKMKVDLGFIISNRARKKEFFTGEEMKTFLKQITKALEELEIKGFPHGNLKPSNILRTSGGSYRISDVGLPSGNESSHFKAPEQLTYNKNIKIDYSKGDVFSLG